MQIPGRVGDAGIPGGGAYVDSAVGGCASTGDGDVHLRFLPCYQVEPAPYLAQDWLRPYGLSSDV